MITHTTPSVEAIRATAHAAFPETLPAAGRFRGITDLQAARVLRAMDAGIRVIQGGRHVWQAVPALLPPFTQERTGAVVAELIRTGLAIAISEPVGPSIQRVRAVPAAVHVRNGSRPLCGIVRPRYRLTEVMEAVDCAMCAALAVGERTEGHLAANLS